MQGQAWGQGYGPTMQGQGYGQAMQGQGYGQAMQGYGPGANKVGGTQLPEVLHKAPINLDLNRAYEIVPLCSPQVVLDVSQGTNKGSLLAYKSNGGKNQQFRLRQLGNGKYVIASVLKGYCLEVSPVDPGVSSILCVREIETEAAQWDLLSCPEKANTFYLRTFCGKGIQPYAGQFKQTDANWSDSQAFTFSPKG